MHETIDTELWSTVDIRLGNDFPTVPLQWFSYGLSQQVANAMRIATRADTNIMRNGDGGLPQDHKMRVRAWRARAVAPRDLLRSDEWWGWCATVHVAFTISSKTVAEWTLDELLRAPRLRDGTQSPGSFSGVPIDLQPGLAYNVTMTPTVGKTERVRAVAIAADPMNTLLPPDLWQPIKLRCYLRGEYTRSRV